ncbi:HXXEE domain-containing protein [Bradyrhizobium sp. SZCCHNR1015]|uniref:HXXEE domain-containing protein n=1 Tax=Bradyrhizobium sp. SZCCHNR1015 TaxID=3057338 RepID=UPI002916D623|nr:HXXEE domain-containing protein [Bradyrhizobium sp. SZCCHNR1015]
MAWLALAAYGAHILEEYTFDWRNWARTVMKLPVEWSDFYVTNALVVVLGAVQAELAETWPSAALTYAALMIINAVFFHILPFLRSGGRFSPGLATALILFFPIAIAMWRRAWGDGVLDVGTAVLAVVAGALLMAYPVVMLNLRSKPYFRQDRP